MDLTSYLLGKKSSGGGGGDLSQYFDTEIKSNTSNVSYITMDKVIKKIPPFTLDESVTSLSWGFFDYEYKSLDLSQMDTSNITNMEYCFSQIKAEELDLSNWNTEKVANFTYMFLYSRIKYLDVRNFTFKNSTNTTGMFDGANYITELDISNWDITGIGMYGNLFRNCGTSCLQSDGAYANGIPYVYVKDATMQDWVLNTAPHPNTWTTSNVVIKQ